MTLSSRPYGRCYRCFENWNLLEIGGIKICSRCVSAIGVRPILYPYCDRTIEELSCEIRRLRIELAGRSIERDEEMDWEWIDDQDDEY